MAPVTAPHAMFEALIQFENFDEHFRNSLAHAGHRNVKWKGEKMPFDVIDSVTSSDSSIKRFPIEDVVSISSLLPFVGSQW